MRAQVAGGVSTCGFSQWRVASGVGGGGSLAGGPDATTSRTSRCSRHRGPDRFLWVACCSWPPVPLSLAVRLCQTRPRGVAAPRGVSPSGARCGRESRRARALAASPGGVVLAGGRAAWTRRTRRCSRHRGPDWFLQLRRYTAPGAAELGRSAVQQKTRCAAPSGSGCPPFGLGAPRVGPVARAGSPRGVARGSPGGGATPNQSLQPTPGADWFLSLPAVPCPRCR